MEISNFKKINNVIIISALIALIIFDLLKISFSDNKIISEMINMIITRFIGGAVFIMFIYNFRYNILNPFKKPFFKSLIIILPCLIVVINNLPIIALLTGNGYVKAPYLTIIIFAIECIGIGFFEEAAFRGVLLLLIIERVPKTKKGIFYSIVLSSAIFGLIHIFNLFSGSGAGAVILQIGYSFLFGGMWAAVLLKTHNLWLCILLHSIYDFCGMLLPTLGGGAWWDTPTIIITVILAILVTIYILRMIFKIKPESLSSLYIKE